MPTPYAKMTPEQKQKAHARTKRWADKNPKQKAEWRHNHYMENRDKYLHIERERAYQKRYGIGVAEYDAMLVAQDGKCKICGRGRPSLNAKFRFFAVDHCHETLKVRGLLCAKCNGALGWYEAYSESIIGYLSVKQ